MRAASCFPCVLGLACLLSSAGTALAQQFPLPSVGGMVMTADNKTLVVTVPSAGQLVYFDTLTAKELKKVEVEFQPAAIALQGKKLFVATKGAPAIHVLDLESGKELQEIKFPGEPVENLSCHPVKGRVYATNANLDVFSIDPQSGKVVKTQAKGEQVLVDPSDGQIVYTSIFSPSKSQMIIQEMPGKVFKVQILPGNVQSVLMKFRAQGADLKFVGGNPNAGSGGAWFSVSRDGKRVSMSGPYRGPNQKGLTFNIAVWDTSDLTTILGQLQMDSFPRAVCYHPQLDLVAALADSGPQAGIRIFNAKSLVMKESLKLPRGTTFPPYTLVFGGQGTKLIGAMPLLGRGGSGKTVVLEFYDLSLNDQQRDVLKKGFAK